MISRAWPVGPFWHFNLLNTTGEFTFDHNSDHLQGMMIIEAIRQAGIAHMHLIGLPVKGTITVSVFNTRFHSFISSKAPVVLRTFRPVGTSLLPHSHLDALFCGVYQWGKLCAEARLDGYAFDQMLTYEDQRTRSLKILTRVQRMYRSQLEAIAPQRGDRA